MRCLLLGRLLTSVLWLLARPDLLSDPLAYVDTAWVPTVPAATAIGDLSVEQVRVLVVVKVVLRKGKSTKVLVPRVRLWNIVLRHSGLLNLVSGWHHSIIEHFMTVSLLERRLGFFYWFFPRLLLLLVYIWLIIAIRSFLLIVLLLLDHLRVMDRFFAVLALAVFQIDHVMVVATGLQVVCGFVDAAFGPMDHLVRGLLVVAGVHHRLSTDHLLLDQQGLVRAIVEIL